MALTYIDLVTLDATVASILCGVLDLGARFPLYHLQAAKLVIWAYDFRFSPVVFWYPIFFVF